MRSDTWTAAEVQTLCDLWDAGIRDDAVLSEKIGRTEHAVKTRRRRLGMVRYEHVITAQTRTSRQRYFSTTPIEDGEMLMRKKASRRASKSLADAILAAFPYGTGELPSVATNTFKRQPPPSLVSRGESMT